MSKGFCIAPNTLDLPAVTGQGAPGPQAGPPGAERPLVIADPVRSDRLGLMLRLPDGGEVPLRRGLLQLRHFGAGVRPVALLTLFHPTMILVLQDQAGTVDWRIVDGDGFVGERPRQEKPERRRTWRLRLLPLAAWFDGIGNGSIAIPPPPEIDAILALPPAARRALNEMAAELDLALRIDPTPRYAGARPPMAVSGRDGSILLQQDGREVAVTEGGRVATLGEGWSVDRVVVATAPIVTVMLSHRTGTRAAWFCNANGERLAHHASALPPLHRQHLAILAGQALDALWRRFVLGGPSPEPESLAVLDAVPPDHLGALAETYATLRGWDEPTVSWNIQDDPAPGTGFVVPTRAGDRLLSRERLRAALSVSLKTENDRLIAEGEMRFPSPIDALELRSDGAALLLDRFLFAYRFNHPDGLAFHVICYGGHLKIAALYFPQIDLLVSASRFDLHDLLDVSRIMRQARRNILVHLAGHAAALIEGDARAPDPVPQNIFGANAAHIGHYIWQDLCGLAYMLEAHADPNKLPVQRVFFHPKATHYCGPIDHIFPSLAGRVVIDPLPFETGIADLYRRNARAIRYTAETVPLSLGKAIRTAAETEPALAAERARTDALRRTADPIIVVGLRVGVRRMIDQDSFLLDLLDRLKRLHPNCAVVLDGLNDVQDRGRAADQPIGDALAEEFALADLLAKRAAELKMPFIDLVNRSTLCSVLWCSRATLFIAPLGAALAKYRWICNTPGMVVTSPWNLNERFDLHIYDYPEWMEAPTETVFNTAAQASDVKRLENGPFDGQSHYTVQREPVFDTFFALLGRHWKRKMSRRRTY